jgi:hypothetical protein
MLTHSKQVSVSEAISNAGIEQTSWTQLTTTTTTTTNNSANTTTNSKVKLAGQVRVIVTFRRQTDIDKEAAVLQERALNPGAAVQKRRASLLADTKDGIAELAGRAAVRYSTTTASTTVAAITYHICHCCCYQCSTILSHC